MEPCGTLGMIAFKSLVTLLMFIDVYFLFERYE